MGRFSRYAAGLGLALAAVHVAHAAPDAVVEAVQMPAWVQRGSTTTPLAPGMELRNGDQLRTGAKSRLLLRTADGSSVKLGENARLNVTGMKQEGGGLFTAALNVGEGAFRFTTDVFAKLRGKRLVNITVATVTAGVRGTDLWGKSDPNKQIVCLIEGVIDVTPPGEQAIIMDKPLQFYIRENDRSLPVAAVDPAQLQQWAAETEIAAGTGSARRGGRWKVVLASPDTQAAALQVYDDVRNAGYAAEIRPVRDGDKRSYDVRIGNLSSRAEAEALAASLKGKLGADAPKVTM